MASNLRSASILLLAGICLIGYASGKGVISSRLQKRFLDGAIGGGSGETQNVLVNFDQSIQSVIEQIDKQNFTSQDEKRSALTSAEMSFTDGVQGPLKTMLNTRGADYESFWISNQMVIKNADSGLVNAVANFPGVASVEEEPVAEINLPFVGIPEDETNLTRGARQSNLAWGIEKIRAQHCWSYYDGEGIVVANIDTGVRHTHETLRGRWRSSYGWYDPYSTTSTPNDGNGHGTHTMGTIAGTNGIGVAPAATWIACKGCSTSSCGGSQLIKCGQWIQCPYPANGNTDQKDCSKAPHVVSNSWGGGGGSNWYDGVIRSWTSAGNIPVFSIGNSGPDCNTAGTPGDRQNVIGVGSTDRDEKISSFSSLGAASDGRTKPDIAAPGGQIRSAWHTGDRTYNTISGTSMACPHVAGVVALMKERWRSATYQNIYDAITSSAITDLDTSTAKTCNSKSGSRFPNNVFGYGRIDAINAINAL